MCLITKQKFPRIALRNIKVGKRLWNYKGQWYTPIALYKINDYQETIIPEENLSLWDIIKGVRRVKINKNKYSYDKGFIHSRKTKYYGMDNDTNSKMFKAVIPFGSLYYYDQDTGEYCSTKLKLIW